MSVESVSVASLLAMLRADVERMRQRAAMVKRGERKASEWSEEFRQGFAYALELEVKVAEGRIGSIEQMRRGRVEPPSRPALRMVVNNDKGSKTAGGAATPPDGGNAA